MIITSIGSMLLYSFSPKSSLYYLRRIWTLHSHAKLYIVFSFRYWFIIYFSKGKDCTLNNYGSSDKITAYVNRGLISSKKRPHSHSSIRSFHYILFLFHCLKRFIQIRNNIINIFNTDR